MPTAGSLGPALGLIRANADRWAWFYLTGTLILVTISGVLAATSPLALKHLVDAISAAPQEGAGHGIAVMMSGTAYLLILVGLRLSSDARPLLYGRLEQRVLASLRRRFFAHLLRLPTARLIHRRNGELLHCADLAAAGVQAIMLHMTTSLVAVLVEMGLMGAILVRLQLTNLAGVFAATSIAYLAVFAVGLRRQGPAVRDLSAASLDVYGQLGDGISHIETLRSFNAGPQAQQSLADACAQLVSRWLRVHRLTFQSALVASLVFTITMCIGIAMAADAVVRGQMSVGGFVMASVYMLQIPRPLEMLGAAARDMARAAGFVRPMLEILAEPIDPREQPDEPSPETLPGRAPSIRIEGLHFGYEPHRAILHGLDLDIPAGRTTAIVGRSGCGKSSLARLLLRLDSPQAGRILIDGQPIDSLSTTELRAMVGWVPQDAGLLQTSVRQNIALGRPAAPREDIERAAAHAQIHRHIRELPKGYDTLLGDRGGTFSGGERQRLAIARAVLSRRTIYLLDEPTSMLDTSTEGDILAALRNLTAGSTTIVIAHRLSTIMHADEIVVLDNGRVVERGRHAVLVAKRGPYAQMWFQQAGLLADAPEGRQAEGHD